MRRFPNWWFSRLHKTWGSIILLMVFILFIQLYTLTILCLHRQRYCICNFQLKCAKRRAYHYPSCHYRTDIATPLEKFKISDWCPHNCLHSCMRKLFWCCNVAKLSGSSFNICIVLTNNEIMYSVRIGEDPNIMQK